MNETVTELTEESRGSWLITTASGSSHIWNLDKRTVTRLPTGFSPNQLVNDAAAQPIIAVANYPKIGECTGVMFPGDPGVTGHYRIRRSTPVTSIEALDG